MQAFWRTLTQSCLLRSHLVTELKQTTTAFRDLCLRVCTYFSLPAGMYIFFGSPHQTAIGTWFLVLLSFDSRNIDQQYSMTEYYSLIAM